MEHAAGVGPVEGTSDDIVPVLAEAIDRDGELSNAGKGTMSECASGQDAEPDLHLVEPAAMFRRENEADSRMSTEPLGSGVTRTSADVVRDDDKPTLSIELRDLFKKTEHHWRCAIWRYPQEYVPVLYVEGGKDVARSFALVLKLSRAGFPERIAWPGRKRLSA